MNRTSFYFRFSFLLILYVLLAIPTGSCQFLQVDLLPEAFNTAIPVAISDVNGDLRDDIVILDQRQFLAVAYQKNHLQPFEIQNIADLGSSAYWSVVVADIDKNGESDIILGAEKKDLVVFLQSNGTWTKDSISANDVFGQGMNAVDINNDGWVDIFLCNDIGYNAVFLNEQGKLKRDTQYFRDLDEMVAEGNYGSVWSDYDNDGDADLYVAKCLAGTQPGDPRRINLLYENQAGIFSEVATENGLNLGEQSWTGDFLDIDNDGSFECLVTNHDAPCALMKKEAGTFKDVSVQQGFNFESTVIQNINEDFNLDGWIDIFLSGETEVIYENQGDGSFSFTPNYFEKYYRINTGISGDLNYDGRPDIYATYGELITGHSALPDKTWINQSSNNNYLSVFLVGTKSNSDAIGARVQLFGPWGVQTREVKAGESYGVQKSLAMRFGVGNANVVDSIIVFWPSGVREKVDRIPTNNYLFMVEEEMSYFPEKPQSFQYTICAGDSVSLVLPRADEVRWNDGTVAAERVVGSPGFYQAQVRIDSTWYTLPGHEIQLDEVLENYVIADKTCVCFQDQITLTNAQGNIVTWNNNVLAEELIVQQGGDYSFKYTSFCNDTVSSDTVRVKFKIPIPPFGPIVDTVKRGEDITLSVEGQNVRWFTDENGLNLVQEGDSLFLQSVQNDTCFYLNFTERFVDSRDTVGPDFALLDTSLNQVNKSVYFEIRDTIIFHSFMVEAEVAGPRSFEIRDPRRRLVYTDTMALNAGLNEVSVEVVLAPQRGLFTLTTNSIFNRETFGVPTPRLLIKKGLIPYPFHFFDALTIYHSSFSTREFVYFFEWDVETLPLHCETSTIKYSVVVDSTNSTSSVLLEEFNLFPNPGKDYLDFSQTVDVVRVFNVSGSRVLYNENVRRLDVGSLKSGVYEIQVIHQGQSVWKKWIRK